MIYIIIDFTSAMKNNILSIAIDVFYIVRPKNHFHRGENRHSNVAPKMKKRVKKDWTGLKNLKKNQKKTFFWKKKLKKLSSFKIFVYLQAKWGIEPRHKKTRIIVLDLYILLWQKALAH